MVATMVLGGTVLGAAPALATEHEVQMLNKGSGGAMVFEPSLLEMRPSPGRQLYRQLSRMIGAS